MRKQLLLLSVTLTALSACQVYPPTEHPDYTVKVAQTPGGKAVAIPPDCPSWTTSSADPFDNQPLPQFGCANARNLAMMVDQPKDLVQPRQLDPGSSPVKAVGAMRRYNNDQTRGFIFPSKDLDAGVDVTTSAAPASALSGDITGGGASSASVPSASSAASPASAPSVGFSAGQ